MTDEEYIALRKANDPHVPLEKYAATFSDRLGYLGDAVTGGPEGNFVGGLKNIAKNPLRHFGEGAKAMFMHEPDDPLRREKLIGSRLGNVRMLAAPLEVATTYGILTKPGTGWGERIGTVAGRLASWPLLSKAFGKTGPGFLAHQLGSDILGGGMLIHQGLGQRIGRGIDRLLGNKPKEISNVQHLG